MSKIRDWRVLLALALVLLFWSSAFPAIRLAVREYGPGQLALFRFLIASGVLLLCAPIFKVRLPPMRDWGGLVLMSFCGVTVYHTLLNWGAQTVTAGSSAFLTTTAPIFTAILAGIFLGERLSWRQIGGIFIAFTGTLLIAFGEDGGLRLSGGAFLILTGAFSTSIFIVLQKQFLSRYRPFEMACWTVWLGTALMLVFLPGLIPQIQQASSAATLSVVYMGVFPGAVAYILWAVLIQNLGASTAASLQFAVPVLSFAIAWVALHEVPDSVAFLGGAIALCGAILVTYQRS